jgi:hypothetical protein
MADKKGPSEELAELQLEETRFRVTELRGIRSMREIRKASIEQSLTAQAQRQAAIEALCWHKKGGKGTESLLRGNDSNFAVVKHTQALGDMIVICQRCGKLWEKPPVSLVARGASSEDRKLYARLLAEYTQAVNFPTDNQPSGSQLFIIHHYAPTDAVAV